MLVCVFFRFAFLPSTWNVKRFMIATGAPPFIAATINAKMKKISTQSPMSDITGCVRFQFNACDREESEANNLLSNRMATEKFVNS